MFDPVLDKARMGAGFNHADNVLPEKTCEVHMKIL